MMIVDTSVVRIHLLQATFHTITIRCPFVWGQSLQTNQIDAYLQ